MWEYKEEAKAEQSNRNLQGLTHQDTELSYKTGDNICISEKSASDILIPLCAENVEVSATHSRQCAYVPQRNLSNRVSTWKIPIRPV